MEIKRNISTQLERWLQSKGRKPLILRGMRQVGKSTAVRHFALQQQLDLIEINLDKHPQLETVFATFDLNRIIPELEAISRKKIHINTLLFFDEAQLVPSSIAALRYFYEEKPELPVILTGSLLDFALQESKKISMPVGRVEYLYLWPITFDEFVKAQSDKFLTDSWQELTLNPDLPVSQALHESILQLLKIYLFVGGMPGVVSAYLDRHDFTEVSKFQEDILTSFKDDFAKYARGRDLNLMQRLFLTLPLHVTKKIKYSRLNPDEKSTIIKSMLDLFSKARIITPVLHSSANGIPLRAQVDPKIFKLLFADTGLLSHSLGLTQPPLKSEIEGVLHEQFIGQELRARDSTHDSELFYWVREKKHGNAEIDYLIQNNEQILPIEVKSGKAGSMRSMHQFMHEKKINIALRFDKNRSSQHNVSVTVQNGHETSQVNYLLRSYPLYLAAQASF